MIVQVIAPGHIGGLETVVAQLLRSAKLAGVPMACVALLDDTDSMSPELTELIAMGVVVVRLPSAHRRYFRQFHSLKRQLTELDITLVHTHGVHTDILGGLAARSLGIPQVSTLHGFIAASVKSRFYDWLQLRQLRKAAAVVAVSEGIRVTARESGIAGSLLHLIPNAVPDSIPLSRANSRKQLGLNPEGTYVGWVGRVSGEKDPLAFLEVLSLLKDRPGLAGVLVGDGPLLPLVRAAGKELIDAGRLYVPGAIPGVRSYLKAFNALALTSVTEGTPMVVLEAMGAEVPVIATAVGGVPRLLNDGAGRLVEYGNWKSFASQVESVTSDTVSAHEMCNVAKVRVQMHYSLSTWWSTYYDLYKQVSGRSFQQRKKDQ